ncbi:MAG: hypothetical protein WBC88_05620 [Candidatus Zixiibacteriota bacterium]
MNHLLDTDRETIIDPEPCASTSFILNEGEGLSTLSSSKGRRVDTKSLKFLDVLIDKSIKRLQHKSYKPRIQDVLKAIQLKPAVAKASEVERSETRRAEEIFWELIEGIREEQLPKLYPQTLTPEDQIQNTIIRLKHLVKNGILPVKTITDLKTQNSGTFNQGKSKESRLTYHRIGRLLSAMGFRKVKTQTGTYAILWDDNLLSQSAFSNDEKNEKQSPVSPVCPASPAL